MPDLRLSLEGDQRGFCPGERIRGHGSWSLDKPATALELRLFWYTQGKGTQDVAVVQKLQITPRMTGDQAYEFVLPAGPYSFSGRLITITWAVELVVLPGKMAERIEFVVSPTRRELMASNGYTSQR